MSDLIPIGQEWSDLKNMASVLVRSGFLPRAVDTAEKAVALILKGRELNIPPMQAFSTISIIQGTPTMNAQLMLSLVYRTYPDAKINFKKMGKDECVILAARPGQDATEFSFTMADATAMNLTSKDNWKKMPKQMLKWRCVTEMCRTLFPECLMGVSYTPEEIDPDLRVNEEGTVITVDVTGNKTKLEQKLLAKPVDDAKAKIIIDRFINLVERCDAENIDTGSLFTSADEAVAKYDLNTISAINVALENKLKSTPQQE